MLATSPQRRGSRGRFVRFGLVVLGAGLGLGGLVTLLWNAILPQVIPGVGPLGYWQGVGLLALCRVLVGGWGRGGRPAAGRPGPGYAKWQRLSPDERQQFRRQWRARHVDPSGGPAPEERG